MNVSDSDKRIMHTVGTHRSMLTGQASGGFIAPFLYPELEWDFRLSLVRNINLYRRYHAWMAMYLFLLIHVIQLQCIAHTMRVVNTSYGYLFYRVY